MSVEKGELIATALAARTRAYCPHSGFAVGAALLGTDGRIFTGSNIENSAYSPTNCAERTAFFTAVHEGVRDFAAIAICGGPWGTEAVAPLPPKTFCTPCGVCRQVMAEFCEADFMVLLAVSETVFQETTLGALLPGAFRLP